MNSSHYYNMVGYATGLFYACEDEAKSQKAEIELGRRLERTPTAIKGMREN
jgi:hypothetical protein